MAILKRGIGSQRRRQVIIFKSYVRFVLILLLILSAISCQNSENAKALAYLSEARAYFQSGHYQEALLKIDTIEIFYSKSYNQIIASSLLKDSINKSLNQYKIDSLNSIINEIKIEIYTNQTKFGKPKLLQKIDSLQSQKTVYKSIISEIEHKESKAAAQCQCRTIMKNIK